MKYLFVGEERSELAINMGVTWEDGRLAAKQLFDALDYCGIDSGECQFTNMFEDPDMTLIHKYSSKSCKRVVAMGNRVKRKLDELGIPYLFIYHPAARGKIRKKEVYCEHVKNKLIF